MATFPALDQTIGAALAATGCADGVSWNAAEGVVVYTPHTAADGLTDTQYLARVAAQANVFAQHLVTPAGAPTASP